MNVCRCGHTTERAKHPEGGPCGAYLCPCDAYADVWDSKALTPGTTMRGQSGLVADLSPVRTYDGELWIGLTTHTSRLAQG